MYIMDIHKQFIYTYIEANEMCEYMLVHSMPVWWTMCTMYVNNYVYYICIYIYIYICVYIYIYIYIYICIILNI